jgi:hypothetical protein
MSDFSKYLLFRTADRPEELLQRLRVTGIVVPNLDPWRLVLTVAHDRVRDEAPLVIEVDYAADHGLWLRVFQLGRRVAELTAASEVGHKASFKAGPWVTRGLLTKDQAQATKGLLARDDWNHRDVQAIMAKRIGFRPASFLRPEDLDARRGELRERFPEAILVQEGVSAPLAESPETVDPTSLEALLDAQRLAPMQPVKPRAPAEKGHFTEAELAEMEELSLAVHSGLAARAAKRLSADAATQPGATIDLAACTTPRAWLDARSRVVPAEASAAVLRELERVVREGRFEGDAAVVVREAAAMLLARCLAAQRGDESEGWFTAQRDAAGSEAEKGAWDIALARLETALR